MTDNEKRAHDIAVAATSAKIVALLNEAARTGKTLSYSYYDMYKAAYNEVLKLVESDFK